jgi:hypothetical protein
MQFDNVDIVAGQGVTVASLSTPEVRPDNPCSPSEEEERRDLERFLQRERELERFFRLNG